MIYSWYSRKILKKAHSLGPSSSGEIIILDQLFNNISITESELKCLISYMKQQGFINENRIVLAKGIALAESKIWNFKYLLSFFCVGVFKFFVASKYKNFL